MSQKCHICKNCKSVMVKHASYYSDMKPIFYWNCGHSEEIVDNEQNIHDED